MTILAITQNFVDRAMAVLILLAVMYFAAGWLLARNHNRHGRK